MQKINLVCVGNLKDKQYISMCEEYKKRISRFAVVNIIELKEKNNLNNILQIIESESDDIISKIDTNKTVLFDVQSSQKTSEEFSKYLQDWFMSSSEIYFVIGGSYGTSNKLKSMVKDKISFSKMTFPHRLFRIMVLEQIYRAYTIANNITYHK